MYITLKQKLTLFFTSLVFIAVCMFAIPERADAAWEYFNFSIEYTVVPPTPVDGVWGPWGPWSDCSVTACGQTGTQTRTRTCTPPQNGGAPCAGSSVESQACSTPACAIIPRASNLSGSCNSQGTEATITWDAPSGYNSFYVGWKRLPFDQLSDPIVVNTIVSGTSYRFVTTPGSYSFAVETKDPSGARVLTRDPASGAFDQQIYGFISCSAPDMCLDIAGVQETVPYGRTRDAQGNCPEDDVCPNLAGAQSTLPSGYVYDSNGNCVQTTFIQVTPPYDPNIPVDPGTPPTSPSGTTKRIVITNVGAGGTCIATWGSSTKTVTLAQKSSGIWWIATDVVVPGTVTGGAVSCNGGAPTNFTFTKKKPIFSEF